MSVMPTLRPGKGSAAPAALIACACLCVFTGDISRDGNFPGERGGGDAAPVARSPPVGSDVETSRAACGGGEPRPLRMAAPGTVPAADASPEEWPSCSFGATFRTAPGNTPPAGFEAAVPNPVGRAPLW